MLALTTTNQCQCTNCAPKVKERCACSSCSPDNHHHHHHHHRHHHRCHEQRSCKPACQPRNCDCLMTKEPPRPCKPEPIPREVPKLCPEPEPEPCVLVDEDDLYCNCRKKTAQSSRKHTSKPK